MNKFLAGMLLFGLAAGASAVRGQDLRQYIGRSLFSDQKANRVGDAVTILVIEATNASNDAKTESGRNDNLSFQGSGSVNLPQVGVGIGHQFQGAGSTTSEGSVRGKISTRVDSVLANGNLVVNGKRTVVVNGEEQVIRISGIVRPVDIQSDNTVYSYNVADATIMIEGSGIVSKVQGPGFLTKFLHLLF
ncbi:MAG TPA: flagellar basal body L-ring protein FlgH [Bacteroidota bacterium]|nr:flagellar basal body L-ring protein FlgH [Bacteroidota bacterium]